MMLCSSRRANTCRLDPPGKGIDGKIRKKNCGASMKPATPIVSLLSVRTRPRSR